MKKLRVGDKVGNFYTVSELASALSISVSYIDKLEEREIFPPANFRYRKANWKKAGTRIYSDELVKKLVEIVPKFRQGIKIDPEAKRLIAVAFMEEKEMYSKK